MSARVCIDDAGFARLRATLARTRDAHEVVHEAGGTAWAPVDPERPFDWDAPSPLSGVKHFFLPDGEVLLRWRGDAVTEEIPDVAPFALVGVRPCDAVAIDYMDRFLAADPCHAARRSRALVVATSCSGACAHGFCLAVDAGPFVTRGFDLGLTRLGHDAIVVDVETEAGAAALAAARVAARPPTPTHLDRLAGARSAARASFAPDPALARGLARLAEESGTRPVAAEEWRRLGPFCFACTGCTSARAISAQGHAYAKEQTADQIADNVSCGNSGEGHESKPAQDVQPGHGDNQSGHHELQYCHVGKAEDVDDLVIFCQAGLVKGKAKECT